MKNGLSQKIPMKSRGFLKNTKKTYSLIKLKIQNKWINFSIYLTYKTESTGNSHISRYITRNIIEAVMEFSKKEEPEASLPNSIFW
jgi:hypothetical protein